MLDQIRWITPCHPRHKDFSNQHYPPIFQHSPTEIAQIFRKANETVAHFSDDPRPPDFIHDRPVLPDDPPPRPQLHAPGGWRSSRFSGGVVGKADGVGEEVAVDDRVEGVDVGMLRDEDSGAAHLTRKTRDKAD